MSTPSFQPSFTEGNFAPESISIPSDQVEFNLFLKNTLELYARLLNRKDTGQYESIELQNNQTFPGADPQNKRMVFRKIVDCGALPNTATKTVAHGITDFGAIRVTRLYGAATRPNSQLLPLPFVDITEGGGNVQILCNTVNVVIATTSDRTPYTSTWAVIEYYRV